MSLLEKITSAFQRKKETALDAYLKALRAGDADQITTCAVAAGLSPDDISRDASILDRAAELIGVATNYPKLQAQNVRTVEIVNTTQKKLDDAIAPLMAELHRTTLLAQQAERDERAARNSVGTLAALCAEYPHLLTLTSMPTSVRDYVKSDVVREAAEDEGRAKIALIERTGRALQAADLAFRAARSAASSFLPYSKDTLRGAGDDEIARFRAAEKTQAAARAEYEKAIAAGKPTS